MSSPIWPMLAAERAALVAYLPTLSEADWSLPSPCEGWLVRDQVAHVVAGANTTPLTFGPAWPGQASRSTSSPLVAFASRPTAHRPS